MVMDEDIENRINEIGGELETIKSVMKAMNCALFGIDELRERDGYSLALVLEEKIDEVNKKHDKLINELKI